MPKNIVVYSDGTGQDGGIRPEQRVSNIYKMYRASRVSFENAIDPAVQVTMYDPGLGTDIGATAMTAPMRFVQKLVSSVDGRGILTNIADCYTFILDHYKPGDRIVLFGFSLHFSHQLGASGLQISESRCAAATLAIRRRKTLLPDRV